MTFLRCRRFKDFEFIIGIVLVWVFGLLVFWKVWGECASHHTCFNSILTEAGSNPVTIKPSTPVYIVEEHHEVLLYWFDAADKGLIKRQNNVLLHIDGHSDGALPETRNILPLFRQPSGRDVYNMMQRNDVFVAAAAFTGLINRYIWVWPPWSVNVGGQLVSNHVKASVKMGTISRLDLNNKPIIDVCVCVYPESKEFDVPEGSECFINNLTNPFADNSQIDISRDECKIQVESAVVEVVSEDEAIRLMKSGHWITSLDSVILDIDEDYYGCEAAVQPLYDVNISEKMIIWIQYYVGHLFCPVEPEGELQADKYFAHILDRLIHLKQFCEKMKNASGFCKDSHSLRLYAFNETESLFSEVVNRNLHPIMCNSDKIVRKAINRLIKYLFVLSVDQMKTMKETGICFTQSPRTLNFDPTLGMRTCDGYNRPNDTIVIFHTPTPDEVTVRTTKLKDMLSSEDLHPGIVTVCRSMRDGYTPRKHFHKIENDVLDTLSTVFKTVDRSSIYYDPYLLGGSFGWPGRH